MRRVWRAFQVADDEKRLGHQRCAAHPAESQDT